MRTWAALALAMSVAAEAHGSPADEDAVWNETLIERLTDYRPDVYSGWKPAQLTAALGTHGVKVGQIGRRIDGKAITRRGPTHVDVTDAISERDRKRGGRHP